MWKPWRNKNTYETPLKPQSTDEQVSMIWDFVYNHLPSKLAEQDRRLWWQDIKLNFMFIFLALLLAFIGKLAFS